MDFYCLCPPLLLHPPPDPKPVYGKVEWTTEYGSADVEGIDYELITCSLVPGHRRAGARIGNLQLILSTSRVSDFIWTYMSECVITDRVLSLFKEQNLTGFSPRKATIVSARSSKSDVHSFPKVWELEISGKAGDAHPDSGIRILYVCPQCGYTAYSSFRKGITVDEAKWDGTDFFTVNGYSKHILVTERVKNLVVQNGLTNCARFRSQDLRWGNFPRPEERPEYSVTSQPSQD